MYLLTPSTICCVLGFPCNISCNSSDTKHVHEDYEWPSLHLSFAWILVCHWIEFAHRRPVRFVLCATLSGFVFRMHNAWKCYAILLLILVYHQSSYAMIRKPWLIFCQILVAEISRSCEQCQLASSQLDKCLRYVYKSVTFLFVPLNMTTLPCLAHGVRPYFSRYENPVKCQRVAESTARNIFNPRFWFMGWYWKHVANYCKCRSASWEMWVMLSASEASGSQNETWWNTPDCCFGMVNPNLLQGIGEFFFGFVVNRNDFIIRLAAAIMCKLAEWIQPKKELLTFLMFIQHYRQYQLGSHFTVRTSHASLVRIMYFNTLGDQWQDRCRCCLNTHLLLNTKRN